MDITGSLDVNHIVDTELLLFRSSFRHSPVHAYKIQRTNQTWYEPQLFSFASFDRKDDGREPEPILSNIWRNCGLDVDLVKQEKTMEIIHQTWKPNWNSP